MKKATATLTSTFLKCTKSLLARIWFLVRLECSLRETKLPSSSHVKSLLLGMVAHAVIPVLSRLKHENKELMVNLSYIGLGEMVLLEDLDPIPGIYIAAHSYL